MAAANPVGGHYNKAKTVAENLRCCTVYFSCVLIDGLGPGPGPGPGLGSRPGGQRLLRVALTPSFFSPWPHSSLCLPTHLFICI